MRKINLKVFPTNLQGLELKGKYVSDILAETIANQPNISGMTSIKAFCLAIDLTKTGIIEVTKEEIESIVNLVEKADSLTVLGKYNIINLLSNK